MSDYLPDVYVRFRERYPQVADSLDALGNASEEAGGLDGRTQRLVKLGITIEQRVVKAHAAQALIDASTDAELVVVGSHGHAGVAGTLLGSVSQRVAMHAQCPVLIVREPCC